MFVISVVVLIVFLRTFTAVYSFVKKRLDLLTIPQPPLDNWIAGHSKTVSKARDDNKFLDLLVEWVAEYGDTYVIWMGKHVGHNATIFTNEPTLMKQICTDVKSFKKLRKLPNRYLYGAKIVGTESMLTGNGLLWATKRKCLTSFFAKTNMAELFDVCKPHMETYQRVRMQNVIGEGATVDLHKFLACTFLSYVQVLGLKRFTDPDQIAAGNVKLMEAMGNHDVAGFKRMSNEKQSIINLIQNRRNALSDVIFEKFQEMEEHPEQQLASTDLVGRIIQANYNSSNVTGKHDIDRIIELSIDDLMTLLLVMDNMVKQLTSMFMFLKDVPEVQKKMFEELREKPVTDYASLKDLKYTEKCLLESLRMAPALVRGIRDYITDKSQRFGPYNVHSTKVRVIFSEWVMHYNEKYWSNPKTFDPERWADGFTPKQFTYLPFFVGARGCLGKHMAMMMMKLTLSVIAQNFDITQQFDEKRPPVISQNHAVMRIWNKVDCYLKPV